MQLSIEELRRLLPESYVDYRGKNLRAICPKCGHDEFGLSLANNHLFGCFRKGHCGWTGNIFTLLAYLGINIRELKPTFEPRAKIDIEELIKEQEIVLDLELPKCKTPIGWKRIYESSYLDGRGFSKEDYEYYKPGITQIDPKYKDFIIFPIYQFGVIKGTVARSNKTKKEIETINDFYKQQGIDKKALRYINSYSDFAKMLLGIEEVTVNTKTIIIVEGLFDKRNTDCLLQLRDQDEVKCLASFKCGLTPEQMFLLQQSGVEDLILLYDPDVPDEIRKTGYELDPYFNTYIGFNEKGNDPGDMTVDEFDEVFDNLKSPSQFNKVAVPKLLKK